MRPVLSVLLAACVTGAAVCIPQHLSAQEEVAQLERDCEAGNAEACYDLAHLYFFGVTLVGTKTVRVEKDLPRAVRLYEKACDGENAEGCFFLAARYCSVPQFVRQLGI